MDDFRLYATALDDADIEDLYNCGGALTNLGDALTGSFSEGANEIAITKNHSIQASEFYE
jgi:hypothetical protein